MTLVYVLIPVLKRPERVEPLLTSLASSAGEVTLRPLFLASPEDDAELAALRASDADFVVVPWECESGDFARKQNLGANLAREDGADWVFQGADDLCFCKGAIDEAVRVGERHGKAVVGTDDCANPLVKAGRHSTHSLVRVDYLDRGTIDECGKLLHEGYDHQYCDNELVQTAMARGEWVFAHNAKIEHLHPFFRPGVPADDTYTKGLAKGHEDMTLYQARQYLWLSLAAAPLQTA